MRSLREIPFQIADTLGKGYPKASLINFGHEALISRIVGGALVYTRRKIGLIIRVEVIYTGGAGRVVHPFVKCEDFDIAL